MRTLFLVVLLLAVAAPMHAQILKPANGTAKDKIQYGCDACCFATNLDSTRTIRASLVMSLMSITMDLAPSGGRQYYYISPGVCATGAFYIQADFIAGKP